MPRAINPIDPAIKKQIVYHVNEIDKLFKKARAKPFDELDCSRLSFLGQDNRVDAKFKKLVSEALNC